MLHGLLRAHEYWSNCGLVVDIVILNERAFSYAQDTQRAIYWLCDSYRNRSHDAVSRPHIFAVRRDMISEESFHTLLATARIVLHADNDSLYEQLARMESMGFDREARSTIAQQNAQTSTASPRKRDEKTSRANRPRSSLCQSD